MTKQPSGEIILYQRGDAPAIDVRLDGDTVWLSLNQIADLLGREAVVAEIATTAADGQTAAEVIARRADAGNARNYLDANELKRLNTLVSAYFDAAEFRAMNHEPTYMKDWLAHLTQLITAMGGKTLEGAGKVRHQDALAHAEAEYAKFRAQQAAQPSEVEAVFLDTVKKVQKKVEGTSKPAPRSKKGQRDE